MPIMLGFRSGIVKGPGRDPFSLNTTGHPPIPSGRSSAGTVMRAGPWGRIPRPLCFLLDAPGLVRVWIRQASSWRCGAPA